MRLTSVFEGLVWKRALRPVLSIKLPGQRWLFLGWVVLLLGTELGWAMDKKQQAQLSQFIENRRKLAESLAAKANRSVPEVVKEYFTAAQKGSYLVASNLYEKFQTLSIDSDTSDRLREDLYTVRQPVLETFGGWEIYRGWDGKFLQLYGDGIIDSLPKECLYFGGTDAGRFVITIMAQAGKKPFLRVTQNQLADGTYISYLQKTLGEKIYVPTSEDSQKCFQDYLVDAQKRLEHDRKFPNEPRQIRPGEDVKTVENRVQVSGTVAVMAVNGLLAKVIFEKNPEREMFIEESFPLEWMYPHLTPHGFILKLNRKPLTEMPAEAVRKDTAFWKGHVRDWLGDEVKSEMSARELVGFVEKTYLDQNLKGFKGDRGFLKDLESRKAFSKMRSAVAGIYAWRAEAAKSAEAKLAMRREAEAAFKQAFAICPTSPEALFRYTNLLVSLDRSAEALLLGETVLKMMPDDVQVQTLIRELKRQPGRKGN